jgi:Ca2+-binding RTX toxin-like protein
VAVADAGGLGSSTSFDIDVNEDANIDAGTGAGDGVADQFVLFVEGGNVKVSVNGTVVFSRALAGLPPLTITGSGDNDSLTVDFSGGNPIPASGLVFIGGEAPGDNDLITLTGGSVGSITYTATGPESGSIDVDGSVLTYSNLEPITDNLSVAHRTFVFGAGNDNITVDVNHPRTVISSPSSESVNFLNPGAGGTVTVRSGAGNDTINLIDIPGYELIVDAGTGSNAILSNGTVPVTVVVNGTAGDDTIVASQTGHTTSYSVNGVNSSATGVVKMMVYALAGHDSVTLNELTQPAYVDGGDGNDTINAGTANGAVWLVGGKGNDNMQGGRNNDLLQGGEGNDTLIGGPQDDVIEGGSGDDVLRGNGGNDILRGGEGNDDLNGSVGVDVLDGGNGTDTASVRHVLPVAYWSMNETSGTLVKDTAGTAQNGKAFGSLDLDDAGPGSSQAPFGAQNATEFNGKSSEYIAVADSAEFHLATGTIQFWFKADDANDGRQTLFSKDHDGRGAGQISIDLNKRNLEVKLESSRETYTLTTDCTKFERLISSNKWYQVTVTFGFNGMQLFVDGVLVASNNYTGGIANNTSAIVIGGSNGTNRDTSGNLAKLRITNPFNGLIDEVAIFEGQFGPEGIAQTRQRGAMGVVGPEDLGTIDGTDTLISIEKVMFTDGALVSVPNLATLSGSVSVPQGQSGTSGGGNAQIGSLLQAFAGKLADAKKAVVDALKGASDDWGWKHGGKPAAGSHDSHDRDDDHKSHKDGGRHDQPEWSHGKSKAAEPATGGKQGHQGDAGKQHGSGRIDWDDDACNYGSPFLPYGQSTKAASQSNVAEFGNQNKGREKANKSR